MKYRKLEQGMIRAVERKNIDCQDFSYFLNTEILSK